MSSYRLMIGNYCHTGINGNVSNQISLPILLFQGKNNRHGSWCKSYKFLISSSCIETTPPQLCKEMYQKLTIAASKNHNGLTHWMIVIASWLHHQMQSVEFLSMSTLNPSIKVHWEMLAVKKDLEDIPCNNWLVQERISTG